MKNHNLCETKFEEKVLVEQRPIFDRQGIKVEGLHVTWIILNNPDELNSYTTEMAKQVVLAFREASNDRAAVAVVFTATGTRAFCSGGNTREYAEDYAGAPAEYRQYMRLFNDMVTSILQCDKPVICRVNGMRVGGGQEIGMACDFSIASDLAVFSQAGPKHGSAPDGGSTDFLPLFVGVERAMFSGTLCQPWSAHRFYWLGGLTQIVPVLKDGDTWVANPTVIHDHMLDEYGRVAFGEFKTGQEFDLAKKRIAGGTIDLSLLDDAVSKMCTELLYTMPDCLSKTIESLRKHKLEHWDRNRESNRAWLALNMMTEANAGFRAFHHGTREHREVDFIRLRQRLAQGARWDQALIDEIAPWIGEQETMGTKR
jgi:6-oxocyclohex-1-ene-carbonyl-CoA hydrolase